MRPAFRDELARAHVADLHEAAARDRLAGPSGWREAVGMRLVRTGFRVLRGGGR
jgi:hypothetical protein